jgi:hypothetical protein
LALDGSEQSTSCDHFTPGNEAQYPSNRRLGGPKRQSGQFVEEKKSLAPARIRTADHAGHILVTTLTELSQLLRKTKYFSNC